MSQLVRYSAFFVVALVGSYGLRYLDTQNKLQSVLVSEWKLPFFTSDLISPIDGLKMPAGSELFKGSLTIVNFWADWCGICAGETPFLADLKEYSTSQGYALQVVASNSDFEKVRTHSKVKILGDLVSLLPRRSRMANRLVGCDGPDVRCPVFHLHPLQLVGCGRYALSDSSVARATLVASRAADRHGGRGTFRRGVLRRQGD